jgi:hypothetical protein
MEFPIFVLAALAGASGVQLFSSKIDTRIMNLPSISGYQAEIFFVCMIFLLCAKFEFNVTNNLGLLYSVRLFLFTFALLNLLLLSERSRFIELSVDSNEKNSCVCLDFGFLYDKRATSHAFCKLCLGQVKLSAAACKPLAETKGEDLLAWKRSSPSYPYWSLPLIGLNNKVDFDGYPLFPFSKPKSN